MTNAPFTRLPIFFPTEGHVDIQPCYTRKVSKYTLSEFEITMFQCSKTTTEVTRDAVVEGFRSNLFTCGSLTSTQGTSILIFCPPWNATVAARNKTHTTYWAAALHWESNTYNLLGSSTTLSHRSLIGSKILSRWALMQMYNMHHITICPWCQFSIENNTDRSTVSNICVPEEFLQNRCQAMNGLYQQVQTGIDRLYRQLRFIHEGGLHIFI